jgi:hypothetical protein
MKKFTGLLLGFATSVALALGLAALNPEASLAQGATHKAHGAAVDHASPATPLAQAAAPGTLVAPAGPVPRSGSTEAKSVTDPEHAAFLKKTLPMLGSGYVAERMAASLGVLTIMGKRLDVPQKKVDKARAGLDTPVDTFPGFQNEPSIAANPADESIVVAFAHNELNFSGLINACSVYLSFNAGQSYFYAADVPMLFGTDFCSDPVVRFSPDGMYVYYSYLSIRGDVSTSDIVVTRAPAFSPTTFDPPTVPLPTLGGSFPDKNWHAVHEFDFSDGVGDGAGFIYVTGTDFTAAGGCDIIYNRSSDYGMTWDFGVGAILVTTTPCGAPFVIQGSHPAGGPGSQLLVCLYNSEADGWAPGEPAASPSDRFDITCRSSADRGSTFSGLITAANNVGFEAPFYLGPGFSFHRWWGTMFPDTVIDHLGIAHITFAHDPTSAKLDAESGNVVYTRNGTGGASPPYVIGWTSRATLGAGARAQGYPAIVAQRTNTNLGLFSLVHVAYYDHFRSPLFAPNLIYDVVGRTSIVSGAGFLPPFRVTDQASLSDFSFIGDYLGLASSARRVHVVWTDRADKLSIFDLEDDVMADIFPIIP